MIEVVQATPAHVRSLCRTLREGDRKEITCAGLRPFRVILHSYRQSVIRKTALIDGEVAAMWGCAGTLLCDKGEPWLITGQAAVKLHPVKFAALYRKEVQAMLRIFPRLVNKVDADYNQAIRLLEIAGFKLGNPEPVGRDGALFRTFSIGG